MTSEAERIAVDHIANISSSDGDATTKTATHLSGQGNAIEMLYQRIQTIKTYVQRVIDNEVPPNYAVLREISSLTNTLPVLSTEQFRNESLTQCNDVMLTAYLATMTQGANNLNELVAKVQVISQDRPGGGAGGRMHPRKDRERSIRMDFGPMPRG